jgi:hypothetical protein
MIRNPFGNVKLLTGLRFKGLEKPCRFIYAIGC